MKLLSSTFGFLLVYIIVDLSLCCPTQSALAQGQVENRSMRVQAADQVKQWPSSLNRWALIIGVDQYRDAQISPLKGAANDARRLAEVLIQQAGFPSDQVIVLATDQAEERQPTRVNVLRRLSNLATVIPKDGLLLFAFAGHGVERGGQAFLLPTDAQLTDDVSLLEDTCLSVTRIRDRIKAIQVKQVMLLLDACRNDPIGRADAPNKLTDTYTRAFNFDVANKEVIAFATLYATAVGERAYEYTEMRQGYFTWAVVEGLSGKAANDQGVITLAGLLRYVQDTVPKRIGVDLDPGKQQHPFAVIEGYKADELVLAVVKAELTTNKNVLPAFDPGALELSFWETIKSSNNPEDFKAYLQQYPNGRFATLARIRSQVETPVKPPPPVSEPTDSTIPPHKKSGKISTSTINVDGKRSWWSTGLIVKKGDIVRVTATGTVTISSKVGQNIGPNGISVADHKKILSDSPTGGLIAVVGADNDDFLFIGTSSQFTATRDGLLFLSINVGELSEIRGAFRATTEVERE